jgi:hypothetical protein
MPENACRFLLGTHVTDKDDPTLTGRYVPVVGGEGGERAGLRRQRAAGRLPVPEHARDFVERFAEDARERRLAGAREAGRGYSPEGAG